MRKRVVLFDQFVRRVHGAVATVRKAMDSANPEQWNRLHDIEARLMTAIGANKSFAHKKPRKRRKDAGKKRSAAV